MKEKFYILTEEFVSALQEVLSQKPYLQVKDIIGLVNVEMKQGDIDAVLNYIGQYPYKEVAGIFNAIQTHVKEKQEPVVEEVNEDAK